MRTYQLLILSLLPCMASAQNRAGAMSVAEVVHHENAVYQQYVDSIEKCRRTADSIMYRNLRSVTAAEADVASRYARLFTPVNYYPDLARRRFSLQADDELTAQWQYDIDEALLNIYLNHPAYVGHVLRQQAPPPKEVKKVETTIKQVQELKTIKAPQAEEKHFDNIDMVIKRPNFWELKGDFYLQIMQNYYSGNWYQGLESNYSWLARVALQANYNNKQRVRWDNKLEMNIGFQTNKNDEVHKVKTSEDLIRYTGKLGLQATKKWYYTLQLVAGSQFMRSFASNSNVVKSDFLSPLNVNLSVGMSYDMSWFKKRLTGTILVSPVALNTKYVDRLPLAPTNGIEEGRHSKTDFGSTFTLEGNWKMSDNINWKTRLYGYTTYKRMELQWENTINMKVSRFLSMTVYVYPRFDDSNIALKDKDYGYFQLKEYTSLGLSYSF